MIAESRIRRVARLGLRGQAGGGRSTLLARTGALGAAAIIGLAACSAGQIAQTANQHPTVGGAYANLGDIALRNITVAAAPGGGMWPSGSDVVVDLTIVNNTHSDDSLVSVTSSAAGGGIVFPDTDSYTAFVGSQSGSSSGSTSPTAAGSGSSSAGSPSATATGTGSPTDTGSASDSGSPTGTGTATGSATSTATGATTASGSASSSAPAAIPSGSASMSANASVRFGPGYGPVIVLTGLKSSLGGGQSVQVTFTFASAGSITVSVPVALTSDGPQDAPSIPVTQTSPSE